MRLTIGRPAGPMFPRLGEMKAALAARHPALYREVRHMPVRAAFERLAEAFGLGPVRGSDEVNEWIRRVYEAALRI